MTTSSVSYYLPGERDPTSSTLLHHHGLLHSSGKYFSPMRIYEAKENDQIIGIVLLRTPDLFLVDINSDEAAILPITSFDQGRLPSRNAMNRLSVVSARVVRTDRWTQVELSCQSSAQKQRANYGLIEYGYLLRCSLTFGEKLRRSPLIQHFQQLMPDFRIRISQNGWIWYSTPNSQSMIAVKNVIAEHEYENRMTLLVESFQRWIKRLADQEDQFAQVKQKKSKPTVKKDPPVPENNAVTRLLESVVREVLDQIILQIEKSHL